MNLPNTLHTQNGKISAQITQDILQKLSVVIPAQNKDVELHEPCFRSREWDYVKQCLDSGWVSSAGNFVNEFEARLSEFTGCKHAAAVVNGTSALHTALLTLGIDYHCEVLLPALTFVATANAISYTGASPHFVDVSALTLTVDVDKLDDYLKDIGEIRHNTLYNKHSNKPIKALVAVNTFGHPIDIDPLLELCRRYHIYLVEDAAESLGSYYGDHHTGSKSHISALSFNGNKIITTGGGGAIITNDDALAKHCRHISSTARSPGWRFDHDALGYNYRLPNINAALGLAQLENIHWNLKNKRKLAEAYISAFNNAEYGRIYKEHEHANSNYWLNLLILSDHYSHLLKPIVSDLQTHGYHVRPCWRLLDQLPMYKDCLKMDLSSSESLSNTIVCLPSSPQLVSSDDA